MFQILKKRRSSIVANQSDRTDDCLGFNFAVKHFTNFWFGLP